MLSGWRTFQRAADPLLRGVSLACLVSVNVASATDLNILTGYTGLVSRGQVLRHASMVSAYERGRRAIHASSCSVNARV